MGRFSGPEFPLLREAHMLGPQDRQNPSLHAPCPDARAEVTAAEVLMSAGSRAQALNTPEEERPRPGGRPDSKWLYAVSISGASPRETVPQPRLLQLTEPWTWRCVVSWAGVAGAGPGPPTSPRLGAAASQSRRQAWGHPPHLQGQERPRPRLGRLTSRGRMRREMCGFGNLLSTCLPASHRHGHRQRDIVLS